MTSTTGLSSTQKDQLISTLVAEVERLKAGGGAPPNLTDVGKDEWTILYHGGTKPTFKGRGEFLRIMLEDAGVPYVNGDASNFYGPTGTFDAFRGSGDKVKANDDAPFPVFFPPAIWHKPKDGPEVHINQVHACVVYLAEKLGYAPASAAERAIADSIALNAQD